MFASILDHSTLLLYFEILDEYSLHRRHDIQPASLPFPYSPYLLLPIIIPQSEFTEASDVWAYGVTLWQLLSLCRLPPYSHLTDRQVMDSAAQRYHGRPELSSVLLRPETQPDVSKELYDLMKSCWHVEPTRRPKFSEVCRFLKQRHECFQT